MYVYNESPIIEVNPYYESIETVIIREWHAPGAWLYPLVWSYP